METQCFFTNSFPELGARIKSQLTCKICMDAPVGIAFLPCGHMGMYLLSMYQSSVYLLLYVYGYVLVYRILLLLFAAIKKCNNEFPFLRFHNYDYNQFCINIQVNMFLYYYIGQHIFVLFYRSTYFCTIIQVNKFFKKCSIRRYAYLHTHFQDNTPTPTETTNTTEISP